MTMSSSAIRVFEFELLLGRDDLGPAVVLLAVDLADLGELVADDAVDPGGVAEDRTELADPLLEVVVLVLDAPRSSAVSARSRRSRMAGRALPSDSSKRRISSTRASSVSAAPRIVAITFVEVVERDQVAPENVCAPFRLAGSYFERRATISRCSRGRP